MKIYYKLNEQNYIIALSNMPYKDSNDFIETNEEVKGGISKVINGVLDNCELEAFKQKEAYQQEAQDILNWFSANDWKVNKLFIGEWPDTDTRWVEYLKERTIKRARLDELNVLLNYKEEIKA